MQDYWLKQTTEPLFPDLLWSRPENRKHAGKLLIIGGNAHGFASAAEAYTQAVKAGIGTARVLLPDSLQKTVGRIFEAGEYAPSTPSGSFAQTALAEMLTTAEWADGVLLAGDFGRNSETAIVLQQFISKYSGQLTLTGDTIEYFSNAAELLCARPKTLLVPSFMQLQKLIGGVRFASAITSDMGLVRFVETLHQFSDQYAPFLLLSYAESMCLAVNGQVSTTKLANSTLPNEVNLSAAASIWWLQNPDKPFEALTTALSTAPGLQD